MPDGHQSPLPFNGFIVNDCQWFFNESVFVICGHGWHNSAKTAAEVLLDGLKQQHPLLNAGGSYNEALGVTTKIVMETHFIVREYA